MPSTFFISQDIANTIATQYGTPVYVTSETELEASVQATLAFPSAFGIHVRYAMKANPNANILRYFAKHGIGIDASSVYEAKRALAAGIAPNDIQITAQEFPHDTNVLKDLVNQGVKINATSLRQLEVYGILFPSTPIGIRLNPGVGSGFSNRTNVGGPASSFGIWHEYIPQIQAIAKQYSLTIERIHTHIGVGADPAVWVKVAQMSLETLKHFPEAHTLDLGGGFKTGRMEDEPTADMYAIGHEVQQAVEQFYTETGRKISLEIEPGTFLVANSTAILTRVQDIVDTGKDGYTFIKTDTGMTEITRPSLYGAQHPIQVFTTNTAIQPCVVVGHCCESGDILTPAKGDPEGILPRELPLPNIGDYMAIYGAGAYCAGMSTKHYNSFPEAAEVLLQKNGNIQLMRKRQNIEDIWHNECSIV